MVAVAVKTGEPVAVGAGVPGAVGVFVGVCGKGVPVAVDALVGGGGDGVLVGVSGDGGTVGLWKTAEDSNCPAETGNTAAALNISSIVIRITRGMFLMGLQSPSQILVEAAAARPPPQVMTG